MQAKWIDNKMGIIGLKLGEFIVSSLSNCFPYMIPQVSKTCKFLKMIHELSPLLWIIFHLVYHMVHI